MTKDEIKKLIDGLAEINTSTEGKFPSFKDALTHLEGLSLLVGSLKAPEPPPPPPIESKPLTVLGKPKKSKLHTPWKEVSPLFAAYCGRLQSQGIKRFNSWQFAEWAKITRGTAATYLAVRSARDCGFTKISNGEKNKTPAVYELQRDGEPSAWEAPTQASSVESLPY